MAPTTQRLRMGRAGSAQGEDSVARTQYDLEQNSAGNDSGDSGAKKKEIYAAEIFFTCWKIAELLDGKIPRGNPNIIKNNDYSLKRLGIDYRVFHLWRRLRNGFSWEELEAPFKDKERSRFVGCRP